MTLTELKEYVQARRIVSELEIAMHFQDEPSVIEPMD
ncbi:FeoC-like transcriptional regulator [uncultured Parasutterella sp.]|nr:FeoC-like transcriptional regulator [uncultured Parasutterella sp.]